MVLVIDKRKRPCNAISGAYAQILLYSKQAVIHKRFPFTIRLNIVKAIVPQGLKAGEYLGRVAVRSSGYFDIEANGYIVQSIGYKYCRIVQRNDGYSYDYKERDSLSVINNRVSVANV